MTISRNGFRMRRSICLNPTIEECVSLLKGNHRMSTTLYVALEPKVAGVEINNDRVLLAAAIVDDHSIGALCSKLGVRSLGEFLSYDPKVALAGMIDDPDELASAIANARPLEWFDPTDGLKAVRALRTHYASAPFVVRQARKSAGERVTEKVDLTALLLLELEDLESVLTVALDARARFRFFIGF